MKLYNPGTFARVCLSLHKPSSKHFALKILSLYDVIRTEQVEHVKSEKTILQVRNIIDLADTDPDNQYPTVLWILKMDNFFNALKMTAQKLTNP